MANRALGAVDGTSLFACSYCGVPARFPVEMRYMADRTFMCFRHRDTTTNLQEAQKHGQGVSKKDEQAPNFPIGVKAGWQVIS